MNIFIFGTVKDSPDEQSFSRIRNDKMQKPNFTIPDEFRDQVHCVNAKDNRSDEEIKNALSSYNPIISEKNVWAFWHSGFHSMPAWCQRNVINWVRLCGPSWTVRILDSVTTSENYALRYLPKDMLPESFVAGAMDGPYIGPHSADFLRGACLFLHGGVFMDVGIILIRDLDRICWKQLEDPGSPFQVSTPWMYGITISNSFVASRKGDPFIKRWHELFVHLWKGKKNSSGLIENPLVSFGQELSFDDSRMSKFYWDFKVETRVVMEYITQVLAWMRLCMIEDSGDGFNCTRYWQSNVLLFDSLEEIWGAEGTIGFPNAGQKMFDLLSVKLDADPESEDYQTAHKLVWRLLTKSSMQKITHGKGLTNSVHLGVLWDENEGKDCEPGTFAELLRHGTVHLQQNRESIVYEKAPEVTKTLKKGLLVP